MGAHHDHPHHDIDASKRIIWTVLILNFGMFCMELFQGIDADSSSLIADSIDFLSDSFSYAITLYVMQKTLHLRAKAALFKAYCMIGVACVVLMQSIHNIIDNRLPDHLTMGWVGALALFVNIYCTILLYRTRGKDSNMQSIWLCSRNDAIGNILILIAAALVYATGRLWPDLLAALVIAGLAGTSALKIIKHAKEELKHDH
ncbi:MAG: cation transporter [Alphaproteobacteria bacterium]